jgi:predicted exporter
VDLCLLVGSGLLVCILTGGAFLLADIYHVNPLWVIVSFISVGFFAGAREDYRKEFRSVRFVAFVCGWVVINLAVFVIVLGLFGWLWLILALALEQILFYMTAYWLFGLRPPLGPGR